MQSKKYNIDRSSSPKLKSFEEIGFQNPEHILLPNGLNLYYLEAGTEDVVRIDLVFKAGTSYQSKKLLASFTSALLKEGTSTMTSVEIAEKLDFYGAYLNASVSKDNSVVTLFCVSHHLTKLLPMLHEIIEDAVFPDSEFEIHRERTHHEFLINSEKARYLANREFNRLIFNENSAYGQYLTEDDYKTINVNDLRNFYKSYYTESNSYIIVSGRPDNKSVSMIKELFGENLKGVETQNEIDSVICGNQFKGEALIEKPDFLQSAIRYGKQVVNRFDPEYPELMLTNTILGGYFGSRLMTNLREEKGMTYGIHSYISNFKYASYLTISTEVNIDQTSKAEEEIKHEINRLQNEKVSDEELKLVKNYIYGNFLKNFDGPFALAEMYRIVNDFGLDFSYYNSLLKRIMNVDSEQIMQSAQKHLSLDDMCLLVVGKR